MISGCFSPSSERWVNLVFSSIWHRLLFFLEFQEIIVIGFSILESMSQLFPFPNSARCRTIGPVSIEVYTNNIIQECKLAI